MGRHQGALRCLLAAVAFTIWSPAGAQTVEEGNFPGQRLRPAMNGQGILDAEWGALPDAKSWNVGMWLHYERSPNSLWVGLPDGSSARVGALLENRLDLDLVGAVTIMSRLELGVGFRATLMQNRPDIMPGVDLPLADFKSGGIGDIRVAPKVGLLTQGDHGVDLALLVSVTLPTGGKTSYRGENGVSVHPELALSRTMGRARFAFNLGYHARPRAEFLDLVVDDELVYRLAGSMQMTGELRLDVALSGAVSGSAPFASSNQTPAEFLGGATYGVSSGVDVFAGGALGISNGFSSPRFRLFGGVRYTTGATPRQLAAGPADPDPDGDGLIGAADLCPELWGAPEARGCPDEDMDGDTIVDRLDRCPNEKGPKASYGCPDVDTDGDGIFDSLDDCPKTPEDDDGFEDDDGCPDEDNDKDGMVDTRDRCPDEAGPPENWGCPDTDRDGDGVVDRSDNCPDEAGEKEHYGCKQKQLVYITKTNLRIMDNVYFKTGKALIRARSHPLLINVAEVLVAHPEIKRIEIEGHTDNVGKPLANRRLSEARAKAVRKFLMAQGVAAERLQAFGFGQAQPLVPNNSKENRSMNRRVEFAIQDPFFESSETEAVVGDVPQAVEKKPAVKKKKPAVKKKKKAVKKKKPAVKKKKPAVKKKKKAKKKAGKKKDDKEAAAPK